MARIRTIKPEFFTSEDIVQLSPLARLLYIATWCEADKEGRLLWKPGTFKLRYFPADACDIRALCSELVSAGVVVLYGDGFAYIPGFSKHQHINPRESESTLPSPHQQTEKPTRKARVATRGDASARDDDAQGGREGKGRERKGREGINTSAPVGALCEFLPDVDDQTLTDWIAVRKAKRAGPITATVAEALYREAKLANLSAQEAVRTAVERGWQGFRADWLTKTPPRPDLGPSRGSAAAGVAETQQYLAAQAAHKAVPPPQEVMDKLRGVLKVVN